MKNNKISIWNWKDLPRYDLRALILQDAECNQDCGNVCMNLAVEHLFYFSSRDSKIFPLVSVKKQ